MQFRQPSRAFTLIELLVVISIISLLSSIVMSSLNTARSKARITAGRQFEANVYHVAGDEAVGIWNFNECSGSSAADSSGNGNNGTLINSPTWSTDTPSGTGCALAFNGTTQYVSVAPSASISQQFSAFSLSLWFKKNTGSGYKQLAGRGQNVWELQWHSSGPHFNLYINNVEGTVSANTPDDTVWHHLVMTFVDSTNTITYYLDGKLFATGSNSQSIPSGYSSYEFNIGARSVSDPHSDEYWNGSIDNVALYAKTLVASEVEARYLAERGSFFAKGK